MESYDLEECLLNASRTYRLGFYYFDWPELIKLVFMDPLLKFIIIYFISIRYAKFYHNNRPV